MRINTRPLPLVLILALAVLLGPVKAARAQFLYDFERDFSTNQNTDTSTWSYRYQQKGPQTNVYNIPEARARNGVYGLLNSNLVSAAGLNGLNGWGPTVERPFYGQAFTCQMLVSADDFTSAVGNPTNQPILAGWELSYPCWRTIEVASWLAPSDGTVNINYEFAALQITPDGLNRCAYYVDKGDASGNLAMGTLGQFGDTGVQTINNVRVTAGDRINFIWNPLLEWNYDYGRVHGQVYYTTATNVVYDDEVDLLTNNVNSDTSTWSYRYQATNYSRADGSVDFTTRNGIYDLIPDSATVNFGYPYYGFVRAFSPWDANSLGNVDEGDPYQYPNIALNYLATNFVDGTNFVVTNGQSCISLDADTIAVVSWLAPFTGPIQITYEFTKENIGWSPSNPNSTDNGILYFIDQGDSTGNLVNGDLGPDTQTNTTGVQVITNASVMAGDRINFVMDPNGETTDDADYDQVRLFAQVLYTSPILSVSLSGGTVKVSWTGTGTLMQAPALSGPWTPTGATTSPYTAPVSASQQMYYRLKL